MRRANTLSGQIRNKVTVIVAVVAILLSGATVLATGSILYRQLDERLSQALERQGGSPGPGNNSDDRAPGISIPGMPDGAIVIAELEDGRILGSEIVDGDYKKVTLEAAESLLQLDPDEGKQTVTIADYGQYRAEAQITDLGHVVLALPLEQTNQTLLTVAVFSLVLTVIACVVAAIVTRASVNTATRPLRELSQTALEVSQAELHQGEVSVPTQVTATDLPPEHEIAKLTQAFNRMLTNVDGALTARQASETKLRRFVADASHELRNPLASIRGYSELAERTTTDLNPDTAFALGRITAESTRMTKLVNDLLLLARLDANPTVELQPVDVVQTVLNAVSDAQVSGPDHNWRLQLPEEGFEVWATPDQLHQAVVNLLSNARTHTPAGTTVTTTVGIRDGRACLIVADDGPGISPDVLEHVFERFSRADAARTHGAAPSTGLGLAIVQAVVQTFGGETTVDSVPGRTCFTIWLNLAGDVNGAN